MKFSILMSFETTAASGGEPRRLIDIEGDLSSVKTYIRLANSQDFKWGAVTRIDSGLKSGDVDRWLIKKYTPATTLRLHIFSYHNAISESIGDAIMTCYDTQIGTWKAKKLLGADEF